MSWSPDEILKVKRTGEKKTIKRLKATTKGRARRISLKRNKKEKDQPILQRLTQPNCKKWKNFAAAVCKKRKACYLCTPKSKERESGPEGAGSQIFEQSKGKRLLPAGICPGGGTVFLRAQPWRKCKKKKKKKFFPAACRNKKASYLCNPKRSSRLPGAARRKEKNLEKRFGRQK